MGGNVEPELPDHAVRIAVGPDTEWILVLEFKEVGNLVENPGDIRVMNWHRKSIAPLDLARFAPPALDRESRDPDFSSFHPGCAPSLIAINSSRLIGVRHQDVRKKPGLFQHRNSLHHRLIFVKSQSEKWPRLNLLCS